MKMMQLLIFLSTGLLLIGGCVSGGNGNQTNAEVFKERCRVSAANSVPNSTTVVMRDQSEKSSVAAGAVTASGSIEPWAALVGPGVATSRGGALAMKDSDTDVEMVECK